MKTSKKLGLGVAMVVALFIGFGTPAGAAGPYPLSVTAGTLTTTLGDFDLAPGSSGTPPCPEKAGTLALTTGSGTWTVAGNFNGRFQFPTGSGNWYQADFTMLPGSGGTWSGGASPYALAGTVGIQVRIYQLQAAGGPVNCEKTNLRCIITAAFSVTGSLTGTGTLPVVNPGSVAVLSGTTVAPLNVASCTAPWNAVGGTNATLTGLTMVV